MADLGDPPGAGWQAQAGMNSWEAAHANKAGTQGTGASRDGARGLGQGPQVAENAEEVTFSAANRRGIPTCVWRQTGWSRANQRAQRGGHGWRVCAARMPLAPPARPTGHTSAAAEIQQLRKWGPDCRSTGVVQTLKPRAHFPGRCTALVQNPLNRSKVIRGYPKLARKSGTLHSRHSGPRQPPTGT